MEFLRTTGRESSNKNKWLPVMDSKPRLTLEINDQIDCCSVLSAFARNPCRILEGLFQPVHYYDMFT
jgi:hypothetical protein